MAWAAQTGHRLWGFVLWAFFMAMAEAAPVGGDAAFTMKAEKAVYNDQSEREDGFSGV